jgi:hypothetical protein
MPTGWLPLSQPICCDRDGHPPDGYRLRPKVCFTRILIGASHDQADAQRSEKSTFQANHVQFSVMDIVTKSFEMSKTGLGIS